MNNLRYAIDHSGLNHNEHPDYDFRTYYERSGALGVKAQCSDTHEDTSWIGYKTVRFYHDYLDDEVKMEQLIREELKKRFKNKFRYCDDCEEEILNHIERDYA